MRAQMLDLMKTLANGIVGEEATAEELIRQANLREARGETGAVPLLRDRARLHRVKVLEMDARLAALKMQYAARFHGAPKAER